MKDKLENRVIDYYNQYVAYNDFFEKYIEGTLKNEKELVEKIKANTTVEDIKEFGMELYVMKALYAQDLQLISDRLITLVDLVNTTDIKLPEEILTLVKQLRPTLKTTKFIIEKGNPVEKEIGYVDKIKEILEERGDLDVLLKKLIEDNK